MGRRWAIMGTGGIAVAFADAILAEGGELVAVSSASPQRAAAFANRYPGAVACAPHAAVLEHAPDVVYVATTNDRHHLDAMACIRAGTPALVEKPFALTAALARDVLEQARHAGVFVAEAMWMRLQPGIERLHAEIDVGTIGPPSVLEASFGVLLDTDPNRRWFSPALGGGALLDLGVYPATLAHDVLGAATRIQATGDLAPTRVDQRVAVVSDHPGGTAVWTCSFTEPLGVQARVTGPLGRLELHPPFHHPPALTVHRTDGSATRIEVESAGLTYRHEVREVERCLAAARIESPRLPHADTVAVLEVLDEAARQVGLPSIESHPG